MPAERDLEHSAGGVIVEDGRVLLIRMRNLEGAEVWTFPKGHLEAGETPEAAALREVAEETGFDCEITGELYKAEYSFFRNGRPVDKDVRWYRMRRRGGDGVAKTPDEIVDMKWAALEEAKTLLTYPSDLGMLGLITRKP
jgi:diadenosine hexaphosphate hydrolase (ATP-forming)